MIKNKLKGIPLLLFAVGVTQLHAQQAVLTSGSNAVGTEGSVSYSVGQLDYISINGSDGSVSQGVQQSFVSTALPVSLINLKATKQEDKVSVRWETVTEVNSHHFIVERSTDGLTFTSLSEVAAAGTSSAVKNYLAEDRHPFSGSNFYRIKQVDNDGSFVYSKAVSVTFDPNENIAVIYPNPANDNITIKTGNNSSRPLSYKLFNVQGQVLATSKITTNLTVVRIRNLSPSNYFLKIIDGNKEIKTFKIIKTK